MKIIVSVIVAVVFSFGCFAQGFEAYVIGGVSFSQIEGDNLKGYNNIGVMAGAATNFLMKNNFSFQQEIVYYQRGSKASADEINNDLFTIKDYHYLDVVLLLNKLLKDKWLIQAGIGGGQLLSISSDDPNDQTSYYRPDVFGTAGAGYFITDNLLINARGQFTITTIHKNIAYFRNNSIALSVRWRFVNQPNGNSATLYE